MQLTYRTNPKTTGWARRAAIAILIGAAAVVITLPIAFFIFLNHYQTAFPADTQNVLSALTGSVIVALIAAVLCGSASLLVAAFFGLHKPAPDVSA